MTFLFLIGVKSQRSDRGSSAGERNIYFLKNIYIFIKRQQN
tara:strand:+ start:182 stop:304 length:123 start_codon:yes stop_codon:yes gene_type:complete